MWSQSVGRGCVGAAAGAGEQLGPVGDGLGSHSGRSVGMPSQATVEDAERPGIRAAGVALTRGDVDGAGQAAAPLVPVRQG
ncbi:MAG: hypothetical protein ACRCSN_12005 [Dermatophilaceae bacterium]